MEIIKKFFFLLFFGLTVINFIVILVPLTTLFLLFCITEFFGGESYTAKFLQEDELSGDE